MINLENKLIDQLRELRMGNAKYYLFYIFTLCITLIMYCIAGIIFSMFGVDRDTLIIFGITSVVLGIFNAAMFLTVLIISIIRKQFKVFLSFLIISYTFSLILSILLTLLSFSYLTNVFLQTFVIGIIDLYLLVPIMKNLNYWSYNKYIEDGYEVVSKETEEQTEFIEKAKTIKKPKWIFFI